MRAPWETRFRFSRLQKLAFVHGLLFTLAYGGLLAAAYALAPTELWLGLRAEHITSENPTPEETRFVTVLAFAISSLGYVLMIAMALIWWFMLRRRFWLAIAAAYLPLFNVLLLTLLFGLPPV